MEDKGTLAKLGEVNRTNYNDTYDEIHHPKAGNVLSPNLVAHIAKVETAKAKDLATKWSYVHAGKSWYTRVIKILLKKIKTRRQVWGHLAVSKRPERSQHTKCLLNLSQISLHLLKLG